MYLGMPQTLTILAQLKCQFWDITFYIQSSVYLSVKYYLILYIIYLNMHGC